MVKLLENLSDTHFIKNLVGHKKRGKMVGVGNIILKEETPEDDEKGAKLKARELKRLEPMDLMEVSKKVASNWKLRQNVQQYNQDRDEVENLNFWKG